MVARSFSPAVFAFLFWIRLASAVQYRPRSLVGYSQCLAEFILKESGAWHSPLPLRERSGNMLKTQRKQRSGNDKKGIAHPLVGIIMGSGSDWDTMKFASKTLSELRVPHETRVVSAHRTPDLLFEYASSAEQRGIEVIIAGAGGAAHLPGMTASKALKGLDSLLSIAQMPGGIPVGTVAIGKAGAINAALLAAAILGAKHPEIREALRRFRAAQTARVLANPDPKAAAQALGIATAQQSQKKRKRP